jgi:hypothetical protein
VKMTVHVVEAQVRVGSPPVPVPGVWEMVSLHVNWASAWKQATRMAELTGMNYRVVETELRE